MFEQVDEPRRPHLLVRTVGSSSRVLMSVAGGTVVALLIFLGIESLKESLTPSTETFALPGYQYQYPQAVPTPMASPSTAPPASFSWAPTSSRSPRLLPRRPKPRSPETDFPRLPDLSRSNKRAIALAEKFRSYPAIYNKPGILSLGESEPVQFLIEIDDDGQQVVRLFEGFKGKMTKETVVAANDISAELTGPPDMLQITSRGGKMRTISSPVPVAWLWDVTPLRPGKAHVTLEVTSYIKNGKDKQPVPFRVLQDTWVIEAHGMEWAKYQIKQIEPIQAYFLGVCGTIIGALAWFGFKGWGRKPDFET
jgi:hypothetical protein